MLKVNAYDRDGVLVGAPSRYEDNNPRHLNLINIEAKLNHTVLALINTPAIIISNQGGIDSKTPYKTLQDVQSEMLYLMQVQPLIKAAFFCPDEGHKCHWVRYNGGMEFESGTFVDWNNQKYRKPQPGMFESANKMGYEILSYTGDLGGRADYANGKDSDRVAAKRAGVPFIDVASVGQ